MRGASVGPAVITPLYACSDPLQVGASIETNDTSLIPAAVAAAAAADVTFIVIGDDAGAVGKGTCSEMSDVSSCSCTAGTVENPPSPAPSRRQADTVDIPGSQLQLVDAVLKGSSAPVVVILLHCRPATFGAGPQAVTGPYNGLLVRAHCERRRRRLSPPHWPCPRSPRRVASRQSSRRGGPGRRVGARCST